MCLVIDNRRRKPRKPMVVYKVLQKVNGRNRLVAPYFGGFAYQPGLNAAKTDSRSWFWSRGRIFGNALHAFVTTKDADHKRRQLAVWRGSKTFVIVRATAHPRDYIAKGIEGDITFRKLRISKRDFEAAMNAGHQIERSRREEKRRIAASQKLQVSVI